LKLFPPTLAAVAGDKQSAGQRSSADTEEFEPTVSRGNTTGAIASKAEE